MLHAAIYQGFSMTTMWETDSILKIPANKDFELDWRNARPNTIAQFIPKFCPDIRETFLQSLGAAITSFGNLVHCCTYCYLQSCEQVS